MTNRISAELAEADRLRCLQLIADLKTALPFLITLEPNERKAKRNLGQGSVGYVRECLNAAQQHPEVLPNAFSVAEFEKDVRLMESLEPLTAKLNELSQMLTDTRQRLGQESLDQAGVLYDAVKAHTKRSSDLKPLMLRLKDFYKRSASVSTEKKNPAVV
ncbi:MAG: hypothetical protein ACKVUS_03970 [Saprospiraceae bacterium]